MLPPALLFLALGLALGSAPRRARAPSLLALIASVGMSSVLYVPHEWLKGVYMACWITVIITAASVHFSRRIGESVVIVWSFYVGLWASVVVYLSGSPLDLLRALPCVLILIPTSWVSRRSTLPAKVASSWLIAIAVLVTALELLPVTPGYMPDHLE